jgi:hypothetical protein
MTYVMPNFPSKKALKDSLAKGESIKVFEPGVGSVPLNGTVYLEGPHYPQPHKWYCRGTMKDGKLVSVK